MAEPESFIGVSVATAPTPHLVVQRSTVERNAKTMRDRAEALGVSLRPHIKTHKTIEATLIQTGGERSGVIVSTLAEARMLATSGFEDVLYAVPLGLDKVEPVCAIAAKLPGLQVLIDSHAALDALLAALEQTTTVPLPMGVWLKVDCGYHRAGLEPHDAALLSLAQRIHESQFVRIAGIYAHAGMSYHKRSVEEIQAVSTQERDSIVAFKQRLDAAGIVCTQLGVGSTPTCSHPPPDGLGDVTEMHPGNYIFYDTMQRTITSCKTEDIAVRLQTRIIGVYPERNELLLDAGFLALTAQGADVGYGAIEGHDNLYIRSLSQEAGVVASRDSTPIDFTQLSIGTVLSILPHHSCATCAMHNFYYVVESVENDVVREVWRPCRGW